MCKAIFIFRYLQSPWLCNLDWSTKSFRGKAMNKRQMKDLLKKIEERMNRGVDDDEEEKFEFLISSTQLFPPPKQLVHMPGYPE